MLRERRNQRLTRAPTVSTGHQFFWPVGLFVDCVVSQAEITDRIWLGYRLALRVYLYEEKCIHYNYMHIVLRILLMYKSSHVCVCTVYRLWIYMYMHIREI